MLNKVSCYTVLEESCCDTLQDIPTHLDEYSNMAGNSLSDYALSGCDTTSVLCRIGISTSHKVLKLDNC